MPGVLWSAVFLAIMFLLNAISVRGFGEAEYWFALIKVVTVIFFIGIGLAMIFGIMKGGPQSGLQNLTIGDAPFVGGLPAMIGVAMIAGFSFQGTELIGVAAGESADPARTIPRAVKQVFWRILLFYVLAIFIIGLLVPYTDPNLLSTESHQHWREPVHAGVQACWPGLCRRADECGDPDRGAVGGQLGHVCIHAHALQPGH